MPIGIYERKQQVYYIKHRLVHLLAKIPDVNETI